jgi:hypothetical protein
MSLPRTCAMARPQLAKADTAFQGVSVGQPTEPCLAPLLLALLRLARRVLRLEPHLRRPAAIGRISPLRHDALQPHAADMGKHGRAVTRQMFSEPDGSPLGPADQLGEPPNLFVSHCRENVVFRQARNPGKPRNTVHCNDCTVRPGSGSAAQVARTIWSQRARAILIRLGDDNADCFVSPARSNQRKMGLGCTSDR